MASNVEESKTSGIVTDDTSKSSHNKQESIIDTEWSVITSIINEYKQYTKLMKRLQTQYVNSIAKILAKTVRNPGREFISALNSITGTFNFVDAVSDWGIKGEDVYFYDQWSGNSSHANGNTGKTLRLQCKKQYVNCRNVKRDCGEHTYKSLLKHIFAKVPFARKTNVYIDYTNKFIHIIIVIILSDTDDSNTVNDSDTDEDE